MLGMSAAPAMAGGTGDQGKHCFGCAGTGWIITPDPYTFVTQYITTSYYNDINFFFTYGNGSDTQVRPMNCAGTSAISSYKYIYANKRSSTLLATSVLDGTCWRWQAYKLGTGSLSTGGNIWS